MWLINHKKYLGSMHSRCVVVHGFVTGHWWAFHPDVVLIISHLSCLSRFRKNVFHCAWHTNAPINVMPEGGGGGTTGRGGDFERPWAPQVGNFSKLWTNILAPGSGSLNNVKTAKANRVLNVGSLDTSVLPSWKYPAFPEARTFQLQ